MIEIVLIAAMNKQNVIGSNNALPWNIPEDLAHFKKTTLGHPMILGHSTWKSLGCRALPNRPHIVVASSLAVEIRDQDRDKVSVATCIPTAIELAKMEAERLEVNRVFVIGGASIYQQTIDMANELLISLVDLEVEGDTFFPTTELTKWKGMMMSPKETKPKFTVVRFERR